MGKFHKKSLRGKYPEGLESEKFLFGFTRLRSVLHRRYARDSFKERVKRFGVVIPRFDHDRIYGQICFRQEFTALFYALLLHVMGKPHAHFLMKQPRKAFRAHIRFLRKLPQRDISRIVLRDTFGYFIEHGLQQPARIGRAVFYEIIAKNLR